MLGCSHDHRARRPRPATTTRSACSLEGNARAPYPPTRAHASQILRMAAQPEGFVWTRLRGMQPAAVVVRVGGVCLQCNQYTHTYCIYYKGCNHGGSVGASVLVWCPGGAARLPVVLVTEASQVRHATAAAAAPVALSKHPSSSTRWTI